MSSSILPREICSGPRCELAVNSEMRRKELKMFAMANTASATSVGCHISHWFLGLLPLYWTGQWMANREWEHKKATLHRSILLLLVDNWLPWCRLQSWGRWWPGTESSWQSPSGSTSHGRSLGNHHPTFVWSLPRWILEIQKLSDHLFKNVLKY